MAEITVQPAGGNTFVVRVAEAGTETRHEVTASPEDLDRLAGGYASPEEFLRACFEFLLAREPKEQILPQFEVSGISRYFPEFEEEIRRG